MSAKLVIPDEEKPLDRIIAANFENGHLKKGAFKTVDTSYKEFLVPGQPREKSVRVLTVRAQDKLSYVGRKVGDGGDEGSRYYIGVLNKKTGKMHIRDAELFHMKPQFDDEIEKAGPVFEEELTFRQQKDKLDAAFGTAYRKRVTSEKKKFEELVNTSYSVALDTAVGHAVSQSGVKATAAETPTQTEGDSILPPYNEDAQEPGDVYTIDCILEKYVLQSLKTTAQPLFNRTREDLKEWSKSKKYPSYILYLLESLPSNDHARWERVEAIMYLYYMCIIFAYKPAMFRRKKCLPEEWPNLVCKYLLDNFTTMSKGERPSRYFPARLKDKLLLHILVMTLILEHGKLNTALIIKDLGVPDIKIQTYYSALGATIPRGKVGKQKTEDGEANVYITMPFKRSSEFRRAPRKKANFSRY